MRDGGERGEEREEREEGREDAGLKISLLALILPSTHVGWRA